MNIKDMKIKPTHFQLVCLNDVDFFGLAIVSLFSFVSSLTVSSFAFSFIY